MHHMVKHRRQGKYRELLTARQMAKLFPRIPRVPWEVAYVVSWSVQTFNRMDEDNLEARFKWFFDWLQRDKYLANDRDLHLTVRPKQTIVRKSKKNPNALTDVFTITLSKVKP